MKNILLLAYFTILITSTSYAQSIVGDTITIYVENKVELKIAVDNYQTLKDSAHLVTIDLAKFQKQLKFLAGVENGLKSDESEKVTYTPNTQIVLERITKKEVFQIDGEETMNAGFLDFATLNLENVVVFISTDDLGDLDEINLSESVVKMIGSLPKKTRQPTHNFFEIKNNSLTTLQNKNIQKPQDFISLSFDFGAGLIKNKPVGDVELKLGLAFTKKGFSSIGGYTSLSFLYDFPNRNKTNINLFLNGGIEFYEKEDFSSSFEFGYLIRRQGDFFEDGTTRFGVKVSSESNLNLTPYLYFNKGFKSAYPGLRLGWRF